MSEARRSRRRTKDITTIKYWKSISVTNYFIEQELLKARKNGKDNDDDQLTKIASDASEMFGKAIKDFATAKGALRRVKKQRSRLVKGGWRVRPIKAAVVKL